MTRLSGPAFVCVRASACEMHSMDLVDRMAGVVADPSDGQVGAWAACRSAAEIHELGHDAASSVPVNATSLQASAPSWSRPLPGIRQLSAERPPLPAKTGMGRPLGNA
ncbi:hypothetical protein GCM10023166_25410 [Paeniglutamicibacter cryotolerans]|uniref:Uncharacterized protein n=1 Tax=Paeniglutamicibacter cryotolerans TaxID=670079 RepID=A0A839QK00_9MICC|nr:hypothetical protein [Paeniglutamicibacter cryotolerans]